jgi:ATP-dependent RNA helicase SUPV3L1/SUV3
MPAGYRPAGSQAIRVDLAEKILRAAFDKRAKANEGARKPAPVKDTPKEQAEQAPEPKEGPEQPVPQETASQEATAQEATPGDTLTEIDVGKAAPPAKADEKAAKPNTRRSKDRKPPRNARFTLDLALPVSIGLEADNAARLLGSAGFRLHRPRKLPEGAQGPIFPDMWTWRPRRADDQPRGRRDGQNQGRGKAKGPHKGSQKGPRKGPRGQGAKGEGLKNHGSKDRGRPNQRPRSKPDTGPARAGGAFDGLADLLKG